MSLYNIHYTTRDRVLSSLEAAMDLVRKLETYARECEEKKTARALGELAEEQAHVSARLFELVQEHDKKET